MGMDSGSQTWLHIKSKMKRESFKKTHTTFLRLSFLTMKSESSGIILKIIELILMHPQSFVKH